MSLEHSPDREPGIGHNSRKAGSPDTLTIEEAARRLGIGRNQCYQAAHRGDIPVIRIGERLLVPRAALDRMLGGEAA